MVGSSRGIAFRPRRSAHDALRVVQHQTVRMAGKWVLEVIIFEHELDAQRVFDVLPKRLAKYGLTLHPEKTRLVDFRRPDRRASVSPESDACSRPSTFDLVGFTHYYDQVISEANESSAPGESRHDMPRKLFRCSLPSTGSLG
jgi:hypothetical protein